MASVHRTKLYSNVIFSLCWYMKLIWLRATSRIITEIMLIYEMNTRLPVWRNNIRSVALNSCNATWPWWESLSALRCRIMLQYSPVVDPGWVLFYGVLPTHGKWMSWYYFMAYYYWNKVQSSAVITRSNLSWYYMWHCDNSGRKWIRY